MNLYSQPSSCQAVKKLKDLERIFELCISKAYIYIVVFPVVIESMAKMNSLKSIYPLPSVSKVLKAWSMNSSAFLPGNDAIYIS